MYQRLFSINKDAKHSVFIFGPRGTGKTSWLKQNLSDALYFDLLDDDIYREVITKPKFFYFDVSIYRTIRPKGPLDSPADIDGPALETLFLQEAKAINDYEQLEYDFYYWRTRSKLEVDFVLYGNKGFHAFEIKRKSKLTSKDFNGLLQFGKDYPAVTLHLLYGGNKAYQEKNIHIYPFEEAITDLKNILLCSPPKVEL